MTRWIWMFALTPLFLGGCTTSKVKSDDEPIMQQPTMSRQDELLAPQIDFEKAAKLYVDLGLAYMKDGQVGRAKSKLLRAKKLAPQLSTVHYALGFYKERIGEYDQAQGHYKEAIARHDGGEERNNYGTFLCRRGRYEQAETQFLKAIEDPNYTQSAEAYENAGLCVAQIPKMDKAKEYFEKAVRIDPRRTDALLELGMYHYNQDELGKSLEYHSLFASQTTHTPRSLWLGIRLARAFNDKHKEVTYHKLLKEKYPQSSEYQHIMKHYS